MSLCFPSFDFVHEFVLFVYHQACAQGCWGMVVCSLYPQHDFVGQALVTPCFWQEAWWPGALCYLFWVSKPWLVWVWFGLAYGQVASPLCLLSVLVLALLVQLLLLVGFAAVVCTSSHPVVHDHCG